MIERDLVEAYFESNGFLVRQLEGARVKNLRKKCEYLPIISVLNPLVSENEFGGSPRLFTADLKRIRSAHVGILGWSNSTFSSAELSSDAKLTKFLNNEMDPIRIKDSLPCESGESYSSMENSLRILVVPALPSGTDRLKKIFIKIKSLGLTGVFTLRSILENLLKQTHASQPAESREIFQFLRLFKAYGLTKDPQLEIFPQK